MKITQLPGDDGQFTPETFSAALHPRSRYQPPQTLVSVKQTANIGGGAIWKKTALDEVVAIARANGLVTHMDGARLLNACVATGISAKDMAAGWDSAWIDFSKGLGAPIGGVIAVVQHPKTDAVHAALVQANEFSQGLGAGGPSCAMGLDQLQFAVGCHMPCHRRRGVQVAA